MASYLSSRPKASRPPDVGELLLSLLFSLILELLGLVTEGASRLSVASETFEGILLRTLGERGEMKLFNSAFSISEQLSDKAASITDLLIRVGSMLTECADGRFCLSCLLEKRGISAN